MHVHVGAECRWRNAVVISCPRLICYTLSMWFWIPGPFAFLRATLKSWQWPGDEATYLLCSNHKLLIMCMHKMKALKCKTLRAELAHAYTHFAVYKRLLRWQPFTYSQRSSIELATWPLQWLKMAALAMRKWKTSYNLGKKVLYQSLHYFYEPLESPGW